MWRDLRALTAAIERLAQAVTYSAPGEAARQAVAAEQAAEVRDLLNKVRMEQVRAAKDGASEGDWSQISAIRAKRR